MNYVCSGDYFISHICHASLSTHSNVTAYTHWYWYESQYLENLAACNDYALLFILLDRLCYFDRIQHTQKYERYLLMCCCLVNIIDLFSSFKTFQLGIFSDIYPISNEYEIGLYCHRLLCRVTMPLSTNFT